MSQEEGFKERETLFGFLQLGRLPIIRFSALLHHLENVVLFVQFASHVLVKLLHLGPFFVKNLDASLEQAVLLFLLIQLVLLTFQL